MNEKLQNENFSTHSTEQFPEEIAALQTGKELPKVANCYSLTHFDENGLLRAKGRISQSHLDYETKHPILLHWKHHAVELFLRNEHLRYYHEGTEYVRNQVQSNYWILGIRNALRSIKAKCVTCRKGNVQTLKPQMAELRRTTSSFKPIHECWEWTTLDHS